MSVSTRFAGTYSVIEGFYFRLGVDQGPMWTGENIVIKSVDAITYEWYAWGELSGWGPYSFYFQIDPVTNAITYLPDQTLNDQPVITPYANPGDLSNVIPLAGANINSAIKDDVEGKDQMNMCYGYYTGGSGPREFYFLLEKIVN
jgi:hypothetical protein